MIYGRTAGSGGARIDGGTGLEEDAARRRLVAAAGLTAGTAGPASAEPGYPCSLTTSATLYYTVNSAGGTSPEVTLTAGRGFQPSGSTFNDQIGRTWIYGYGAEHTDRNGWVMRRQTDC